MKVKGKIFQIIKWEEKEKYFFSVDFGDKPVDLIHISPIPEENPHWSDCGFFSLFKYYLLKRKPVFKYENFVFNANRYINTSYWDSTGMPILISRPHNYKLDDIVEVEVTLKEVSQ